eukprot:6975105-Ditylum_brightwellii.AAC.1
MRAHSTRHIQKLTTTKHEIDNKSLEFANQNIGNKHPPIPFYMSDSEKKLSPSDYQTYKLRTNPKDKKLA